MENDSKRMQPKGCKKTRTLFDDLADYFKNTPKEKIESDWKSSEKWVEVGVSVEEFLKQQIKLKQTDEEGLIDIEEPVGKFILENIPEHSKLQMEDGLYIHYSSVCGLLRKYKEKK